jgi:6-phosphogluconate dehydrogenase
VRRDQRPELESQMQIAMIGLGRMGGNMTERLLRGGHQVVTYDRSPEAVSASAKAGAVASTGLEDLVARLTPPRAVWIMVPAGQPVDDTLAGLQPLLTPGDVLIDGGNSNYHDTIRRGRSLDAHDLALIDCGTSGGIWGLEHGYCLMVGGPPDAVSRCEPAFRTLAPPDGYAHVGPTGAGHYVKMIHNGIEYGMLQAYAEGYELLHASKQFSLDLAQIAALWNRGSVVRSWMNELAERAFAGDPSLEALRGYVEDSGEGRWTVQEGIDLAVPTPVIALALMARFRSRQDESFGAKVIAALRREFGGHAVKAT